MEISRFSAASPELAGLFSETLSLPLSPDEVRLAEVRPPEVPSEIRPAEVRLAEVCRFKHLARPGFALVSGWQPQGVGDYLK